jgi:hypothetical protein
MTVYSYVIEHDLGFAPNPYHGACTLACCKPLIRKHAKLNDIVLGMGAAKAGLSGHLCYWMRVDEILTFDEYWADPRFRRKRPNMAATTYLRYGDNIYHHEAGDTEFRQEDSFHSLPGGELSLNNRKRDTATTQKVLIGRRFAYWGRSGVKLPKSLSCFDIRSRGHKNRFNEQQISRLVDWLGSLSLGIHDEPAHWQYLDRKKRRSTRQASCASRSASP